MKKDNFGEKAEIFKALSNPVRLDVIDCLLDGEKCVNEIVTNLQKYEQTHISKCLFKLKEVGLLNVRKEGNKIYYSLVNGVSDFIICFDKIVQNK